MRSYVVFALLLQFLIAVQSQDKECCNQELIEAMKKQNGGEWPIGWLENLIMKWNRQYSMVATSAQFMETLNLTCMETVFGVFKNKDYLYNKDCCFEEIDYEFNLEEGIGKISQYNYKGNEYSSNIYFNWYGECCFGTYECSDDGRVFPSFHIYCESEKYCEDECCQAEVDFIKKKFCEVGVKPDEMVDCCVDICNETCEE